MRSAPYVRIDGAEDIVGQMVRYGRQVRPEQGGRDRGGAVALTHHPGYAKVNRDRVGITRGRRRGWRALRIIVDDDVIVVVVYCEIIISPLVIVSSSYCRSIEIMTTPSLELFYRYVF